MATGKNTPAKRKPLSEVHPLGKFPVGAARLTLGVARTAASTQRLARVRGDLVVPVTGAVAGYLASAMGGDPLGPLGPGWGEGALDFTSPWQMVAGATVGTAALMYQRNPYATGKREQRRVVKAFTKLGAAEPPSTLYPNGRPVQVALPTATPAGSKVVVQIPDGSARVIIEKIVPLLERNLGRITVRPVPPPPSAGQKVMASARRALPSAAASLLSASKQVEKDMLAYKHVELTIRRREALSGAAPTWEHLREIRQPGYAGRSVYDPWHRGNDEDGNPVRLSIAQKNLLSGGEPGSGKTSTEHVDIAAVALDPTADIYLLDPSAAEFNFWDKIATESADSVESCLQLVIEIHRLGEAALKRLAASADEREALGLPRSNVAPGERTSWIFIDELLALTGNENRQIAAAFAKALADIVGRFRKVGFHVVASTLKPTGDVIPTQLRDLITWKQAFRCTTPDASTAILGDRVWAQMGYGGHLIDKDGPVGVSYLLAQGGYPIRMRGVRLEGEDRLDARDAALRVRGLPPIPRIKAVHDPERAALLDPSRPAAEASREREVVTLAKPAAAVPEQRSITPPAPTGQGPAPAAEPAPAPVTEAADEPLLLRIARFAARHTEISGAMISREFDLDWGDLATVMTRLEEAGVVDSAPASGSPMRQVLVTPDDLPPVASSAPESDDTTTPAEGEAARHGYAQRRRRPRNRTRQQAPAGATRNGD